MQYRSGLEEWRFRVKCKLFGTRWIKIRSPCLSYLPDFFGVRETWSLAYQAMLGLTFEVGDDMDIVAGYRFMGVLRSDYGAFELERLDIHNFELGVRFYLGD